VKKLQKYARLAKEQGADGAKIIKTENIFVRDWVFWKCKFGCEGYGERLTCPPRSPSPEQTRRMVSEYRYALLVHFKRSPDPVRKNKKKFTITEFISDLERTIFLDGYFKAWGMGCGPCRICRTCPDECKHPRKARPSMEACGISVFETARKAGFPIEVVTDFDERSNRYGLILIE
jgi:predicted metal-binding protein